MVRFINHKFSRHTATRLAALMLAVLLAIPLGVSTPPRVYAAPSLSASAIAAGNAHTCALVSGGVQCWGFNANGQVGDGTTTRTLRTPVAVSGLSSGVTAIDTGDSHTCALVNGGVQCWGWNRNGQVGDGTTTNRFAPVAVSGLSSGVTAIVSGGLHTCALVNSAVQCWGLNSFGQLGDGTNTDRLTPVAVSGLSSGVTAITAGNAHTCALVNGGVWCWGYNASGGLGDGTTTPRSTPVAVSGLSSGVTAITAGDSHTCALVNSGVQCWGFNNNGQVGDGTTTPRSTPVAVSGLSSGVTAIAAGYYHTCALVNSGVQCWGLNGNGQVGDGTITSRSMPVAVSGLSSSVTAIAAGGAHNCALLVSGGVKCWGNNGTGQLGDNTTTDRRTPVAVVGIAGNSPEIDVQGNNVSIASSDSTPSAADHTDFGSVNVSSGTVVRTFTIQNTGNTALTLSSPTLGGANAGDFTISSAPAASVADGGATTFQVTFDPVAAGTRTATVSIGNNDSDENPYTFAIQGVGIIPTPSLSIPTSQRNAAQGSFSVPVNFTSDGASIASVGFSLDYDQSCLTFDATDANSDGVPEAITGLPSGFTPSISHDANDTTGELDISLFDTTAPINTLSDGALFTVAFTVKPSCITTDGSLRNVTVNFASTPAPSFGDPAAGDVNGTSSGATIPLQFNATPTALNLSNSSVNENAPSGTTVGALSTVDPDAGDTHTYSLVSGSGDTDNARFTLTGNTLQTNAVFDFETKNSYTIRLRTTDNGGLNGTLERSLTISVNDVYEAPTGITPTDGGNGDGNPNTVDINENVPAGGVVASFSPSNPDATNSYTYALVPGTGSDDNASFTLTGNTLTTNAPFDAETKNSYTIRVRITDSHGNSVEQVIVITINNLNDAPVAVDDLIDPLTTVLLSGETLVIPVLNNDHDDDGNSLSISSVTPPASGTVTNDSSQIHFTAPNSNGTAHFSYQISDGLLTSAAANVTVNHVKPDGRGDCNSTGAVTAADFIAIVLEIFDTHDTLYNGNPAWWLTYTGDYAGSPRGCDANAHQNGPTHTSDSVSAGDIICTVLIFFNQTCGSNPVLAASPAITAQMAVADTRSTAGQAAQVTVNLTTASHSVAAATFAVVVDASKLTFDATDANGDGVPDAVTLNVPASMSKSVTWNAAQSQLEVAVFGAALPLPTLPDGPLATVNFQVAANAPAGATALGLQLVSLSDPQGQDLAVEPSNGTLTINENTARTLLYLPVVVR